MAALPNGTEIRWHIFHEGKWDFYSSPDIVTEIWVPSGPVANCKLINTTNLNVAIGWPKIKNSVLSVGRIRVAVLFVDFIDKPTEQNIDPLFSYLNASNAIFDEISYGRLDFFLDPLKKWLRMSKKSTYYNINRSNSKIPYQEYVQAAVNSAEEHGYNFHGVSLLAVIANPDAKFDFGPAHLGFDTSAMDGRVKMPFSVTSGQDAWRAGAGRWLVHESGHTMGLVDLYNFEHENNTKTHCFVGYFSLMGFNFAENRAPGFFGWERWLMGWLDETQVTEYSVNVTTYTLTPLATVGGLKIIVIPTSSTTGIVLESRHAIGIDDKIPREGVLVYTVDTSIKSGYGPIIVQGAKCGDKEKMSALLQIGANLVILGFKIEVIEQSAIGEIITITRA